MPYLKKYDLFISHAWSYGFYYESLIRILDNASLFQYRNYSAPHDKPLHNLNGTDVQTKKQIREAIDRKIRPVNCVLVLSGMYAAHRECMQYELDAACKFGKPIIGIKPYSNIRVPVAVSSVADIMVPWRTDSIISAIRTYSL